MQDMMQDSTRPPLDGEVGPLIGLGTGVVKALFHGYGFVRTDDGKDLFFMPTAVDASVCKFRELKDATHMDGPDRVTFEIFEHRRGQRARRIQRVPPDAR